MPPQSYAATALLPAASRACVSPPLTARCARTFIADTPAPPPPAAPPACLCVPQGEVARRRPLEFGYSAEICPVVRKGLACPTGDECPFAHSVFESFLHPDRCGGRKRARPRQTADGAGREQARRREVAPSPMAMAVQAQSTTILELNCCMVARPTLHSAASHLCTRRYKTSLCVDGAACDRRVRLHG
jgi:hypothetical protein